MKHIAPVLMHVCLLVICVQGERIRSNNFWTRARSHHLEAHAIHEANVRPPHGITAHHKLDFQRMQDLLLSRAPTPDKPLVVTIPIPVTDISESDIAFHTFALTDARTMHPSLMVKNPTNRAFTAIGMGNSAHLQGVIDIGINGFHAQIFNNRDGSMSYIDPYSRGQVDLYSTYDRTARHSHPDSLNDRIRMRCLVQDDEEDKQELYGQSTASGLFGYSDHDHHEHTHSNVHDKFYHSRRLLDHDDSPYVRTDTDLATYRTAVATTVEYTAFFGGTVAGASAAITTTITRVSDILTREVGIKLELLATNDDYIHTTSDSFSNNDGSTLLSENISYMSTEIGSANFDIGHIFSTGGGGIAYLGSVCGSNKAGGVTGSGNPSGDSFDVDYVAHEIGHQFDAPHTFDGLSGSCGPSRSANWAYEPGSGTTIMAYAGICSSDNTQSYSDPYYHFASLSDMSNHRNSNIQSSCPTVTAGSNTIPTVLTPDSLTIPRDTPFVLAPISYSDADNDDLFFTWDSWTHTTTGSNIGNHDMTNSPLFRSWPPTTEPTRTLPTMDGLISGSLATGETIPTQDRELKFVLVVRDRSDGASTNGGYSIDITTVTVSGTGWAFINDATASTMNAGTRTIEWTRGSYTTGDVNVHVSYDNGNSWYTLAQRISNSGAATVYLPCTADLYLRLSQPLDAYGNTFFILSSNINNGASDSSCVASLDDLCAANCASTETCTQTDTTYSCEGTAGLPTEFTVSQVTLDSANLGWSASSDSCPTFSSWEVLITEGAATTTEAPGCTNLNSRDTTSCTVIGLDSGTQYIFSIQEVCTDAAFSSPTVQSSAITTLGQAAASDLISPYVCPLAEILTVPNTTTFTAPGPTTGYGCQNCESASHANWYTFTATVSGAAVLSTCPSEIDTRLFVYTGTCNGLALHASNDDDNNLNSECIEHAAHLQFEISADTTYYIEFDDRWSTEGFTFTLQEIDGGSAISNENNNLLCTGAYNLIDLDTTYTYSALSGGGCITCQSAEHAAFYRFTADFSGSVTVSSCTTSSPEDTNVIVHSGDDCNSLTEVGRSDDACDGNGNGQSYQSQYTFQTTVGTTYYVEWDNKWDSDSASWDISVSYTTSGYECSSAVTVFAGTHTAPSMSISGAPTNPEGRVELWYSFTSSTTWHVDTCGSNVDTHVRVYEDIDCNSLVEVTSSDDNCGITSYYGSRILNLAGPSTWFIVFDDLHSQDSFDFTITEATTPIVDLTTSNCTNANIIDPTSTNSFSARIVPKTLASWHSFVASGDGSAIVSSCNTGVDTFVRIYSGNDCASRVIVTADDDSCTSDSAGSSSATFAVTSGTSYFIEWSGKGTDPAFDFTVTEVLSATFGEYECSNAVNISLGTITSPGPSQGNGCNVCDGASNAVWYIYTAIASQTMAISTCGSGVQTRLFVYQSEASTCTSKVTIASSSNSGCGNGNSGSLVTFSALTGITYYLEFDDAFSSNGFDFDLFAPTCVANCGSNGHCGSDGLCVCDDGYYGSDCASISIITIHSESFVSTVDITDTVGVTWSSDGNETRANFLIIDSNCLSGGSCYPIISKAQTSSLSSFVELRYYYDELIASGSFSSYFIRIQLSSTSYVDSSVFSLEDSTCDSLSCSNGATCSIGKCQCTTGYDGSTCSDAAEDCKAQGITCQIHGYCSGTSCTCVDGYTGDSCEISPQCADISCSNNGVPNDKCTSCTNCDNSWGGFDCNTCNLNCVNGIADGTCSACVCDTGFAGTNCDSTYFVGSLTVTPEYGSAVEGESLVDRLLSEIIATIPLATSSNIEIDSYAVASGGGTEVSFRFFGDEAQEVATMIEVYAADKSSALYDQPLLLQTSGVSLPTPCDASTPPGNGTVGTCTDTIYTTCDFTCNAGHYLSGSTVCVDGVLDAGVCHQITCNASSAPLNGNRGTCTAGVLAGGSCQINCDTGYTPSGTSDCDLSGVLTSAYCIQNCNSSTSPANGTSGTCGAELIPGTSCDFACDTGFLPSDSTFCSSVGVYSPATCEPICDASVAPVNGFVGDCTATLASGSTCQPLCQSGYNVSGPTTCTNGFVNAAVCHQQCLPDSPPVDGSIGSCDSKLAYGETCSYDCNPGFYLSNPSECTSGGTFVAATCIQITCDVPVQGNGTQGDCPASINAGTVCQTTCNAGWTVSGSTNCSITGDLTAAQCIKNCDASSAPNNGNVGDCTDNLVIGTACHPVCDENYLISGETQCSLEGVLTPAVCDAYCNVSMPPDNGSLGDCTGTVVGGSYILYGDSFCQPTCDAGYSYSSVSYCSSSGVLTPSVCYQDCPVPTPPGNGTAGSCSSSLAHGDVCVPDCNLGYEVSGQFTCNDGSYSSEAICERLICSNPCATHTPVNGICVGTDCEADMLSGTECTLQCNSDYSISGPLYCNSYGNLPYSVPTCVQNNDEESSVDTTAIAVGVTVGVVASIGVVALVVKYVCFAGAAAAGASASSSGGAAAGGTGAVAAQHFTPVVSNPAVQMSTMNAQQQPVQYHGQYRSPQTQQYAQPETPAYNNSGNAYGSQANQPYIAQQIYSSAPPSYVQTQTSPLPPNWSQHVDAQNRVYYWNSQTNESLWVRPMQ